MAFKKLHFIFPFLMLMSFDGLAQINKIDSLLTSAKNTVFSNYAATIQTSNKIIELSQATNQMVKEASGWNIKGVAYQFMGNQDSALACFDQVYRLGKLTNDKITILKALQNSGGSYSKLGNFVLSEKKALEALSIAESLNDHAAKGKIYGDLANNFIRMEKLDMAIDYLKKAIANTYQYGDSANVSNLYNSLGSAYSDAKQNNEAKIAFIKAIANAKKYGRLKTQITSTINLSSLPNLSSTEAIAYLLKTQKLATQLNDKSALISIYYELSKENYEIKKYPEALDYAEKAINLAKETGDKAFLQSTLEVKSDVLFRMGEAEKGFENSHLARKLQDSLYNKEINLQFTELEKKYQTEKKQQQITLLNKENTIQKLSISKKNNTIYSIIGLLLALIVFAALFYNRYKLKNETRLQSEIIKQQDLATKAVLNAEENERRRIAGDLHDGVGQLFSTVKMNLSGIEESIDFKDESTKLNFQKTIALVDESCKEVRSISHQMAPNVLIKSGLVSAIRDFITKVDERKLKINMEVQGLNERFDNNVEMVLYRVIQETVNNVIKHAKANRLDIQIISDLEGLSVMVEDNGVGFDTKNAMKEDGLGLKNIISRINYLNGTVDFDSSLGKGTLVSIFIPKA